MSKDLESTQVALEAQNMINSTSVSSFRRRAETAEAEVEKLKGILRPQNEADLLLVSQRICSRIVSGETFKEDDADVARQKVLQEKQKALAQTNYTMSRDFACSNQNSLTAQLGLAGLFGRPY